MDSKESSISIIMEIGWSMELDQPILISELVNIVSIEEKPDLYLRTEDDGYILLTALPLRIIKTNLQEVAMYPILSVHMLSDRCSDQLFQRFEALIEYIGELENDAVIAQALHFEYVEYQPRSRPDW